jgi:hypothetical protein
MVSNPVLRDAKRRGLNELMSSPFRQRARGPTPNNTTVNMPAGWNIRVTSFDSEGKPRIVRNFLAYEPDRETAIELVRKRVPVTEGELAEAVAEVSGNEFAGPGMRPGDVRRLGRKSDFDDV